MIRCNNMTAPSFISGLIPPLLLLFCDIHESDDLFAWCSQYFHLSWFVHILQHLIQRRQILKILRANTHDHFSQMLYDPWAKAPRNLGGRAQRNLKESKSEILSTDTGPSALHCLIPKFRYVQNPVFRFRRLHFPLARDLPAISALRDFVPCITCVRSTAFSQLLYVLQIISAFNSTFFVLSALH